MVSGIRPVGCPGLVDGLDAKRDNNSDTLKTNCTCLPMPWRAAICAGHRRAGCLSTRILQGPDATEIIHVFALNSVWTSATMAFMGSQTLGSVRFAGRHRPSYSSAGHLTLSPSHIPHRHLEECCLHRRILFSRGFSVPHATGKEAQQKTQKAQQTGRRWPCEARSN